jgi:hypothetical protein
MIVTKKNEIPTGREMVVMVQGTENWVRILKKDVEFLLRFGHQLEVDTEYDGKFFYITIIN